MRGFREVPLNYNKALIELILPSQYESHPHNSKPNPANAAARLKQELAATSAAGAFDADSSGSEATAE